ncbi:MAG TPA: circadian clock protein KaiC [Candidatus Sulfotelmatobacter sp.]|nr:circadian clock protein KaiC [Candidatus Sulfotelmatobacter sp.]
MSVRQKNAGRRKNTASGTLPKAPTGIQGLDEITLGGFPRGRPTLICGSAGAGKTLLAMEFLVCGAIQYNEPGVFMAFEETAAELAQNVRSLGFDLEELAKEKKLVVDYVRIERSEIDETGDYDLEGLFIRLGSAIDAIGAKRVVLDTIENLFAGLQNQGILRAELRRLFRWLKDKGVTAVITAERGEGALTRHGLEEYVSDCVILLDHRVSNQLSTRRLRIVKYRGTAHGTNEYPFLIDEGGFSVLPVTSLGLHHMASEERISSGIPRLDTMLGGEGFYRGSTILLSGTAGTGKTSLAMHCVDAACRRGERCLYFSFEESPAQMVRNMRSIGLNLDQWIKKDLLHFHSSRATLYGLEMHLAVIHREVQEFDPKVVVLDPVGSLIQAGDQRDAHTMLIRLIDFLKQRGITAFLTNLSSAGNALEKTAVEISSIVDTWLFVRHIELGGERNRALYVLKSRGMAHSNQLREFLLTERGVDLLDVYVGPDGVLTGSSRLSQEAREKEAAMMRQQQAERRQRELKRKREILEERIASLRKEFEMEEEEAELSSAQEGLREKQSADNRQAMARSRKADTDNGFSQSKKVSKV